MQLAVGQPLYVTGDGIANPLGKLIAAGQIGPSGSQLAEVRMEPIPPGRRGPPPPPR